MMTFGNIDIYTFIVSLLITGGTVGFLSGLFGIGGGLIMIPSISLLLQYAGYPTGLSIHIAGATSLSFMVFNTSIASYNHIKMRTINWHLFRHMAIPIMISAVVGVLIAHKINAHYILLLFTAMLVYTTISQFKPQTTPEHHDEQPHVPAYFLIILAFIVGLLAAIMGIGVGVLVVIGMRLVNYPLKSILSTNSLLSCILAIPAVLTNIIMSWQMQHSNTEILAQLPPFSYGYINLLCLALMLPLTVIFAKQGVIWHKKLSLHKLRLSFAVLLLVLSIKEIYTCLKIFVI